MSMTCPFCRAMIPDDSRFCDQCGKELLFCPECGKPKRGTQCAVCGSDLVRADVYFKSETKKPVSQTSQDTGRLFLVAGSVRIELREGIFGRTQGVYPEFSGDSYVSGRHGEFRCNGGIWQIRDFGSTNGTFVGGRRLETGVWTDLSADDELKIATIVYKLSL